MQQDTTDLYFTETQPLIFERLLKTTRILWILSIAILVASLIRAYSLYLVHGLDDARFSHQLLNSLSFAPYILVMLYADFIAKANARLGTQITILATFCMLAVQVILNGDQSVHNMMAVVLLMVLAGFFTNTKLALATTIACLTLVVVVTVFELMGLKAMNPESSGYFSVKSTVYVSLILLATHSLIKVVMRDFFAIQDGLIQEKLRAEHVASHDPLTGLYNRYYSEKVSNDFFANMEPHEKGFLLFLDIDNFKMINTRFGHDGGDFVLKVVADRLKEITKNQPAIPCRIGGDEFILLLISTPTGAQELSRKILNFVSKPFELFNEEVQVTCSIGISRADENSSFQNLYRQADTAMHRAKHAGKNILIEHHQIYTDEELFHAKTLSNLKMALERSQFVLHYQPQIDLNSKTIIGMEALIRWQLGDKQILPDKFIELSEQYGLIHSISEWAIQQACKDCKYLHDKGFDDLFVAVNISADLLKRNTLAQTVTHSLLQSGLPARALELELTESALFEKGNTAGFEQLQQIREQGVELAIDDFGTGYSNLQYLRQLDVQKLKIDKSFVMPLDDTSDKAYDLVSAIIDIAKRFQLKTVGEGIENNEVATKLQEMKCDVAQGFYWSRAIPIDAVLDLLEGSHRTRLLAAPH